MAFLHINSLVWKVLKANTPSTSVPAQGSSAGGRVPQPLLSC